MEQDAEQGLIVQTVYNDLPSSICTDISSDIHSVAKTGESRSFVRKISSSLSSSSSKIVPSTPGTNAKTSINNDMKRKEENSNENHGRDTKNLIIDYPASSTSSTKSKKRSWVEVNVSEEKTKDQSQNGIHQNLDNHQNLHLVGGNIDLKKLNSLESDEQKIKDLAKEVDKTTSTIWNTRHFLESAAPTTSNKMDVINSEKKQTKVARKNSSNHNLDIWGRIPPRDVSVTCSNCGKHVGVTRFTIHLAKCMGFHCNTRKSSM